MRAEAELFGVLERWLQGRGLSTNIEIPWPGCLANPSCKVQGPRWDIVAWDDAGRFEAFEVKSRFSMESVDQAAAMLPACRHVSVAVAEEGVGTAIQRWPVVNREYGIGLIVIAEDSCKRVYKPQSVCYVSERMEAEMLRLSKSLSREDAQPGARILPNKGWRWSPRRLHFQR